ncbi:hypothetical protein D3C81_1275490 [compost metagenome]
MAERAVVARGKVGVARAGAGHAQRLVDGLLGQRGPVDARGVRHRFGRGGHAEVGVLVDRAQRMQRQEAQARQHLAAVVAHVFEPVAGVVGQAGTMRIEVADGDGFSRFRIGQCKPWQVLDHRGVPADAAAPDLPRHYRGADGFRHGGELEHGVGVDRRGIGHQSAAKAPGVNGLIAAYHRDGHAGHARAGHQVGGQRIDLGDGAGDLRFGSRIRRRRGIVIAAAGGQGRNEQAAQRGSQETATLLQFGHGRSPDGGDSAPLGFTVGDGCGQ